MKYQQPKLRPLDESFPAYAACMSGNEASSAPASCITGVNAENSVCKQGVHPDNSCVSGTLPATSCFSGSGDNEW